MKQTKIVILGAGHVGTHCALSLMFRGLANEIVLIDTDEEKAKSQALDLDDMGACLPEHGDSQIVPLSRVSVVDLQDEVRHSFRIAL